MIEVDRMDLYGMKVKLMPNAKRIGWKEVLEERAASRQPK